MPKQRVRRIVVDGEVYRWRVRPVDPHWLTVRVWRDGERTPMADLRIPFDDPWVNYPVMLLAARHAPERFDEVFAREPVGPRHVANLIRVCVSQEWRCRTFEVVDGKVQPVSTPATQARNNVTNTDI
ncbi:hypothetical protein GA0074695_5532 [Micromonospora viridifaciens]|uniref:Uncharacterized protein n=1 Tax=Micromonospora viridifaciens TaxID=1881 RepID=A0A1C4ZG02_MICVI|nr:hypothetical protein [Micromonospora viridifaciens]SCF31912.1 hypothetical protein GA0074695_5532 [Micromonospora viridifaciens]